MPFQQVHLDSVTAAASELTAARAQHDAAKARLDQALELLAPGLNEGDVRTLGGAVTAVTKTDGKIRYVVIPGLLDPDPVPPQ